MKRIFRKISKIVLFFPVFMQKTEKFQNFTPSNVGAVAKKAQKALPQCS
jgi:hypothetical protein